MGIRFIKSISPDATLGLWDMRESWQELLQTVALTDMEQTQLLAKRTDQKKREWLSCRALLKEILPQHPPVTYDPNGRPRLDGGYYLSMSHSGDYASIYLSRRHAVGVDIQKLKPSISRGADYFLHASEQMWVDVHDNLLLHLIWCTKEAAFKSAGNPEIDLKNHIITKPFASNQNGTVEVSITGGAVELEITVEFMHFDAYVLAWTN